MSDPQPQTSSSKAPSAAARYLFIGLIGLVAGIIGTVVILQTVESGKTWQDRYPYATMHLLQAHTAQLGGKVQGNRCTPSDSRPHLEALRVLANDLEPAFPSLGDDARFSEPASAMRATLDRALDNPPRGCEALDQAVKQVAENCKACHQAFRT